ncbi:hypothetical protein C8Q72DRAFT_884711 [Fomitopsis betulina]|nr:hypothetical protein C8Q72DRAFT_884711 [Fomitopsis betulina]
MAATKVPTCLLHVWSVAHCPLPPLCCHWRHLRPPLLRPPPLHPPPLHPPPPYALLLCRPRLHLLSTQWTSRKRWSWTLEAEQRRTNSKVSQNSYNVMNT